MSYIPTLSPSQLQNIQAILASMRKKNITNIFTQAAMLAVESKESNFKLIAETSYRNTPNDRIRAIFGYHFKNVSEAELTTLKANDEAFFNKVYGGMYGNAINEGFKYRGRGFNEITFRGNYAALGSKLGVDLVGNPDLLNTVPVAADAATQYFIDHFHMASAAQLAHFGVSDINGFKDIQNAVTAIYQSNAGWSKNILPDSTGGYALAQARGPEFYAMLTAHA